MPPPLEAMFRTMPHGGQRLWLLHSPPPPVPRRGAVLYVHPWGEEMNKSRRMAALTARALAEDGWTVLQPDLAGCGDSSCDWRTVDTDTWLKDLQEACSALRQREPQGALWLWGLRAGALWCAALAARMPETPHLLLWQPATQGKAQLQQFLRLKAASQMVDGGGRAVMDELRTRLAAGLEVEVAGYAIGASLARGLEAASLAPFAPRGAAGPRIEWLETGPSPDGGPSPAARNAASSWEQAGWHVQLHAVAGPSFWQTVEIEDAPGLVQASVERLREAA